MRVEGWQLAACAPDRFGDPPGADALAWQPLARATSVGVARPGITNAELDGQDWWYRASLDVPNADRLVLQSVATIADVYLDGVLVAHSESMFRPIEVTLDPAAGPRELAVCCRALGPRLAQRRRPRARWRTQLVESGNLRFHRTMLLGRAPGFAPGPAAVGLCGPVDAKVAAPTDAVALRARMRGSEGVLSLGGAQDLDPGAELVACGPTGEHRGPVAEPLCIPDVARWWPHTHGRPDLYEVTVAGRRVGSVGFRALGWPEDWEADGFGLSVNGVEIFCRGAVWTPLVGELEGDAHALAERLGRVAGAGMNMLRIPGTATYESDAFYDLCDRLGILVWQDMMFANLDYPDGDPEFVAEVEAEARFQLRRLGSRPCLAVVCGGSECAQQVTMLGLDPALARGPLYTEILPAAVSACGVDAAYVPNAPWGGDVPFRPDTGVANYYGVGAYLRDVSDARLADVGFATECLAFSNVGDRAALSKQGIPRDTGAGWDFEDVRDHYLREIYRVEPVRTRWSDPERYLELSRAVTGEVMAETIGHWRRADSPTQGALILWLADLFPGSGWGLLDERGEPKAAFARVAQAMAPRATWFTAEGLAGLDVHVANDGQEPLEATLSITLYRHGETPVESAQTAVALPAHGYVRHGVEELIGRFVDIGWTYRFGPPNQDLVVARLVDATGLISQGAAFPVGRPLSPQSPGELGLTGRLERTAESAATLVLSAGRVVHGVRIHAEGWRCRDDFLTLEPGRERTVALVRIAAGAELSVVVGALNLSGSLNVRVS